MVTFNSQKILKFYFLGGTKSRIKKYLKNRLLKKRKIDYFL